MSDSKFNSRMILSGEDVDLVFGSVLGAVTKDARPMSLYLSRAVKNVADFKRWAKEQGFPAVQDDLHVTIAWSHIAVDWIKVGEPWQAEMIIPEGGPRLIERFNGGAIVLQFASNELTYRHNRVMYLAAGEDDSRPEFQPHVTIMWELPGAPFDFSKIEPYRGEIVLGPEIFREIDPNWRSK